MNKQETIIIKAELEKEDLAVNAASALKEIQSLKEAMKQMKEEGKGSSAEFVKMDAALKDLQQSYRDNVKILQQNITANKAANGSYNQLTAALKVEEALLKKMEGTLGRNADGSLELTDVYRNQHAVVAELKEQQIAFDQAINVGTSNVGNYSNSIKGMEAQLAELQDTLSTLDVGSRAFIETKEAVDKLSFSVDLAKGKIDELGNREAKNPVKEGFNDAFQSAMALTNATNLLVQLFGEESKAGAILQKSLGGVALIQNALVIIQSKGAIQDTIKTVKIKLQTAAQYGLNAATKIYIGLGVGAFIGAIAWAYNKLKGETIETADAQEELNTSYDDFLNKFDELAPQTRRQIEQAQQLSDKESEKLAAQKNGLETQKLLNEGLLKSKGFEEDIAAGGTKKLEAEEDIKNIKEKILELDSQILIIDDKIVKAKKDENEEDKKAAEDRAKKLSEAKERQRQFIEDNKKAIADYIAFVNDSMEGLTVDMVMSPERVQREKAGTEQLFQELTRIKINEDRLDEDYSERKSARRKKLSEDLIKQQGEDLIAEHKYYQQLEDIAIEFTESISGVVQSSFDEAGFNIQKFAQSFLLLMLDTLEKITLMSVTKATVESFAEPDSVATFGASGAIRAAILAALIKTAFGAVKGVVSSTGDYFEQGGEFEIGGRRHSQGGTKFYGEDGSSFEAEQGEKLFILNRNATQQLKALMAFNSLYAPGVNYNPKRFLATGGIADGGFSSRRMSQPVNDELRLLNMYNKMMENTSFEVKISKIDRELKSRTNTVTVSNL